MRRIKNSTNELIGRAKVQKIIKALQTEKRLSEVRKETHLSMSAIYFYVHALISQNLAKRTRYAMIGKRKIGYYQTNITSIILITTINGTTNTQDLLNGKK